MRTGVVTVQGALIASASAGRRSPSRRHPHPSRLHRQVAYCATVRWAGGVFAAEPGAPWLTPRERSDVQAGRGSVGGPDLEQRDERGIAGPIGMATLSFGTGWVSIDQATYRSRPDCATAKASTWACWSPTMRRSSDTRPKPAVTASARSAIMRMTSGSDMPRRSPQSHRSVTAVLEEDRCGELHALLGLVLPCGTVSLIPSRCISMPRVSDRGDGTASWANVGAGDVEPETCRGVEGCGQFLAVRPMPSQHHAPERGARRAAPRRVRNGSARAAGARTRSCPRWHQARVAADVPMELATRTGPRAPRCRRLPMRSACE